MSSPDQIEQYLISKRRSQMEHAIRRCRERYSIILSRTAYEGYVKAVQRGECEIVGEQKNGNRVVRIWDFDGLRWITAIFDVETQVISTFLPSGAIFAKGVVVD